MADSQSAAAYQAAPHQVVALVAGRPLYVVDDEERASPLAGTTFNPSFADAAGG